MKKLLELKELAEEREDILLERAIGELKEKLLKLIGNKQRRKQVKLQKENYKLRELRINELYNLRYRQEKEDYLRTLEAGKAYLNLLY
ncbi:MAG: hypothetical protein ACW97V_01525 [Promethearchaeota archaeon]